MEHASLTKASLSNHWIQKYTLWKPFRSNPFKESAASRLNDKSSLPELDATNPIVNRFSQSISFAFLANISSNKLPCELASILHNDTGMIWFRRENKKYYFVYKYFNDSYYPNFDAAGVLPLCAVEIFTFTQHQNRTFFYDSSNVYETIAPPDQFL